MNRLTRKHWLFSETASTQPLIDRIRQPRRGALPQHVESLEARRLLAAVVVSNAWNKINGNTASIASLIANPGSDGISFVEALTAANATPGADVVTFADNLAGATINTSNLVITDSVTIKGPAYGPAILNGPAAIFQTYSGG